MRNQNGIRIFAGMKTSRQALSELINKRGVSNELGINESTLRTYRKRLKEDKMPQEKMDEILLNAGYTVAQEKLWKLPK